MKIKNKLIIVLFFYHIFFIGLSYFFFLEKGGDANLYWFNTKYTHNKSWVDFLNYGTDFLLFLNYPFVKFGLPIFIGFLIYGLIGFLGISKWIKWAELVFEDPLMYKGVNVLMILFFLPNLHFWTASLGKEPLLFWSIASIMFAFASKKYLSFSSILGTFLVVVIRPHVALMVFFSLMLLNLSRNNYTLKKQISFISISVLGLSLLVYLSFQLTNIKYFNYERIKYFNNYSILSNKNSGSYVPMLEYNYFYRLFSFYFRPLFYDSKSLMMFFASIENCLILFLHLLALYFVSFYKFEFPKWLKMIVFFSLISGLIYIQRFANLGHFMRAKVMFQPFLIIGLLFIVKKGLCLTNYKNE